MSAGSDRLERTRLAILEHIHRKEQRRHGEPAQPELPENGHEAQSEQHPHHRGKAQGWYDQARSAVEGWWRYHPAHMAVDIARPTLSSYARRKPMQYLGMAAAAGAVLFVLRPWKLVSVTGVLVALVKSPQVAGMVMSALSSSHNPRGDEAPPEE